MIFYLRGKVHELFPTFAVIDVAGIGYYVRISLQTYQKLEQGKECFLYTQQIIREDAHLLFGFSDKKEKEMFNLFIGVNGIGAVSAIIILSSLELSEISHAILSGNSGVLQKVKGIGAKSAERIIIDLRDKIKQIEISESKTSPFLNNELKEESLSALEVLGISRKISEKIVNKILQQQPELGIEELVKQVLKNI